MSKEQKQKPELSVQESTENKPKAPPVIYTPTPFGPSPEELAKQSAETPQK